MGALRQLAEDKESCGPRLELSVCRVTDKEAAQLGEALKGNTTVTDLNLSFNQIGDVGIQAFVTALASGAAKGLKVLKLDNNPFGDMGKRMLSGVKMMRKGLDVQYESAIDGVVGASPFDSIQSSR